MEPTDPPLNYTRKNSVFQCAASTKTIDLYCKSNAPRRAAGGAAPTVVRDNPHVTIAPRAQRASPPGRSPPTAGRLGESGQLAFKRLNLARVLLAQYGDLALELRAALIGRKPTPDRELGCAHLLGHLAHTRIIRLHCLFIRQPLRL